MDAIEVFLNGGLFSVDAVTRAAHRYTADYYTDIATHPDGFTIRMTPVSSEVDTRHLAERFRNDALDEQLRERIRAQTNDLHTLLVDAALSRARPPSGGAA